MIIKLLSWNTHVGGGGGGGGGGAGGAGGGGGGGGGGHEWRMTERLGIPLLLFKSQFPCHVAENKDIPRGLWLKP